MIDFMNNIFARTNLMFIKSNEEKTRNFSSFFKSNL